MPVVAAVAAQTLIPNPVEVVAVVMVEAVQMLRMALQILVAAVGLITPLVDFKDRVNKAAQVS
jgi:hypothetical protein